MRDYDHCAFHCTIKQHFQNLQVFQQHNTDDLLHQCSWILPSSWLRHWHYIRVFQWYLYQLRERQH